MAGRRSSRIAQHPPRTGANDSWAPIFQGKHAEAVTHCEQALRLDHDTIRTPKMLGSAHDLTGNSAGARKAWQRRR